MHIVSLNNDLFLMLVGLITGLIDAVAGGGGLISVPAYMIVLGAGPLAIGTNKVTALVSTIAALIIYHRQGFIRWRENIPYLISTGVGAALGAGASRFVPPQAYKSLMLFLIPILLVIIFRRKYWQENIKPMRLQKKYFVLLGVACGFYDGIAGPGGGTLMFLSLFIVAGFPLTDAIGTAKLANLLSASFSLATYSSMDLVNWRASIPMSATIFIGAVLGSYFATKRASLYARSALLIVSLFLLIRLL